MREGLLLYSGRADPHLLSAADVAPDIDNEGLSVLEGVQRVFLRRLLGLQQRSMTPVLHSETGCAPIKYRRLLAALGYLRYLSSRPAHTYAAAAFREAINLAVSNSPSWASDLLHVVARVSSPHHTQRFPPATLHLDGQSLVEMVTSAMHASVHDGVHALKKAYLLHGRDICGPDTLALRPYLRVPLSSHRFALTRLILSDHRLASERGRWQEQGRAAIPDMLRLCRLCRTDIETPEHVLLVCEASATLLAARVQFLKDVYTILPSVRGLRGTSEHVLKILITKPPVSSLLAAYAFKAMTVIEESPMYRPEPQCASHGTELLTNARC